MNFIKAAYILFFVAIAHFNFAIASTDFDNGSCESVLLNDSSAKTVELFNESGHPVSAYADLIESLNSGDMIVFANGKKFRFLSYLGRGNTNIILEVQEVLTEGFSSVKAMRVPHIQFKNGVVHYANNLNPFDFFKGYYEAHDNLLTAGVRIPIIFDYLEFQYAIVERLQLSFTALDFFSDPKRFAPRIRNLAEQAFYDFAESIYIFNKIGDFGPEQLFYSEHENKWILVDWSIGHEVYDSRNWMIRFGVFQHRTPLDRDFISYIEQMMAQNNIGSTLISSWSLNVIQEANRRIVEKRRD